MKKNILMVYPEYSSMYWSPEQSLKPVNKKTLIPPLGLLTVASIIPACYNIRLVDMNVLELTDADIIWADIVFIYAMIGQEASFLIVVSYCQVAGKPVIASGSYPTSSYEFIQGVDHFILGECENSIPLFIDDFKNGTPDYIYREKEKPDIKILPVPRYDLIDTKNYAAMPVQFSRKCPISSGLLNVVEMFGRIPRLKAIEQFLRELDCIYDTGYRGPVFIVDENFFCIKSEILKLLGSIRKWQSEKNFPFNFFTGADICLSSETEILDIMADCGFNIIFLKLEIPDHTVLSSIDKRQNAYNKIFESIKTIQGRGIEVAAGFIHGSDKNSEDVFDRQINFIQKSGIPAVVLGLQSIHPGTRLFRKLQKEGRIISDSNRKNSLIPDLNYLPLMDIEQIAFGFTRILETIYAPDKYFERSLDFVSRIPVKLNNGIKNENMDLTPFIKSVFYMFFSGYGLSCIRFLVRAVMINPGSFLIAADLVIKGTHLFGIARTSTASDK